MARALSLAAGRKRAVEDRERAEVEAEAEPGWRRVPVCALLGDAAMSRPLPARTTFFVLAGLPILALAPLAAQAPLLRLQPTANPGQSLQSLLLGSPNQAFATLLDTNGGPVPFLGETIWMSLAPAILESGQLDVTGAHARTLPTPNVPGLVGIPFFAQSIVLDPLAPNALFRASNGQSAILHSHSAAIVFEFRNAAAEGVTGNYDTSTTERLMAGFAFPRTQTIVPANPAFPLPITMPLVTTNARLQQVYRAGDLAATGQPEFVTALRWRPLGPVVADAFARVQIALGNSAVIPDYTIDPFSQLPVNPGSGLSTTFAANYLGAPVVVCDAPYSIQPTAVRPDGFIDWPPLTTAFVYDGRDSLLVDYRVVAGPATLGANGFTGHIMVNTTPLPNTRVFAPQNALSGPINPFTVTTAGQGDNTLYELQVDLVRAFSTAITRFQPNPGVQHRCFAPLVAASVPPGTSYRLDFEAALDQAGTGSTGFVVDPTLLPPLPWLRVRVTFVANPFDGARPSIDTLVIPVD